MSSSCGDCHPAPGWVWVGHLMLNGEPALRRRHSGNTFSATGHSVTHSDARAVECIRLSAATEATGAKAASAEADSAEADSAEASAAENCSADASAAEADSGKEPGFWNDPRPAVRPNSTTP